MSPLDEYRLMHMRLLNTYDDKDEAEEAALRIDGDKRLASERDGTVIIYNLFGKPTWGNFFRLGLYNLGELQKLLSRRETWLDEDKKRHEEIIIFLHSVAKNQGIIIPEHWI